MASAEEAIYATLAADGTVAGLVGTRIYPLVIPQDGTFPAVVYQRVSGERIDSLGGPSGLAHPRIQVTSWATTYSGVNALAAAVREALDGFSGTAASTVIGGIRLLDENDIPDIAVGAREARRYGIAQDYSVWNEE